MKDFVNWLLHDDRKTLYECVFAVVLNLVFLGVAALVLWPLGRAAMAAALANGYWIFWIVLALTTGLLHGVHRLLRVSIDSHYDAFVISNLAVSGLLQIGWCAFAAVTVDTFAAATPGWTVAVLYVVGLLSCYVAYVAISALYMGSLYRMVNLGIALLSYIVVGVCLAFGAFSAHAQAYPNKPIRYVVGFTSGTATDLVARLVSARLSERWGQQVIVDNRVGAAGTIGAGLVAKSTPDGYTLYMASSTMVVSPHFMDGVTYDVFKDFAPVVLMVGLPMVLIVPAQSPANSVQELIALAKAKPGQLNYADTGRGTSSHISAEVLSALTGVQLTEISFKSTVDALNAVVRGDVAMYYPNLAGAMPLIKQGRVKALALSTSKRSSAAPEIATMAESVPGFDSMSFYGIVVPAKTPKDVIAKLNAEVNAVIAEPDMRKRLQDVGGDVIGGAPDVLTARMKAERDQVSQVVKRIQAREGRK